MRLIMILEQTHTSKLQGTHWVPYAPINCVFVKIQHVLRKQKKMWSNGVGERAFTSMKMEQFYAKILNSFRNIYIFTLYFQILLVIEVFQQQYANAKHLSFDQISKRREG